MAYIGKTPSSGIRNRFIYTATAGQTTFTGTDNHSRTLSYTDAEFTDVFLNGVKLDKSDYTATSGTSIVLDEGAAVDDILEVLAFDTFSVFSGEFSQDVTIGADLTVDTDTLYVDSTNDRVGIGTTSPEGTLHVESVSNNSLIMDAPANRYNSVGFQTAGVDKWWLGRADSDQIAGDAFFIGIDGGNATDAGGFSNKLVINQSGNVGVGTTPASNYWGSGDNVGLFTPLGYLGSNGNYAVSLYSNGYRNDSSGFTYLGINNQTSTASGIDLEPSGTIRFRAGTASGTAIPERIRIQSNGHTYLLATYANTTGGSANVHIGTSGELFRSTSSQNYKNTITDATHGLTELLTLRPVTYKHNSTGDVIYGGLIAEEVHAAGLTEFVEYNDNDEPDALHYGNMVALCVKAIQDLNAKVATLETKVAALEASD